MTFNSSSPLLCRAFTLLASHLLERIGAKLISQLVVLITTADGISWFYVIGKDDFFLTSRTSGLFQGNADKVVSFFPQPEGKPRSKRAVNDVARLSTLRNL